MPSLLKSRRAWAVAAAVGLAVTIQVFFTWYYTAYERGRLMAYIDHARGHYEIKAVGLPPHWRGEYARLLQQKYGVEVNPVAGCMVSEDLGWYVEGYNSISGRLLCGEYGKNIFEECADQAREKWQAEHSKAADRPRAR
jgi:hypothetical protein